MLPFFVFNFAQFVKLKDAYQKPGQRAQIKLPSGAVFKVLASSKPFPAEQNHSVLLKLRGDIPAGSTKLAQYGLSVRSPLDVYVTEDAAPALYDIEVGMGL